jgi:hypothetical protein
MLPLVTKAVRMSAAATAVGLLLLTSAVSPALADPPGHPGRAPAVSGTSPVTGGGGAAALAPRAGRTVSGPRMWDPAAHRRFLRRSQATISQTTDLTNQVVQVTWRGFTPSSQELYDPDATDYPVMVAECKGTHPTRWSQCFGADNGGVAGSFSAYGPMNTAYATTARNGTGETDIQLLTAEEDQQLGCDIGVPCSLVIVPSQGGNVFDSPPHCADHSQDTGQSDIGAIAFSSQTGSCSWGDRIIVPMYFAPTPTDCPVANANFSVIGSPMLARAMSQWQSRLCTGADPLSIQYDSAQSEPLARLDFENNADDVALTTRPATGLSKRKYTYAPLAISAVSIAAWVDNPSTGKPVRHLKLNARLVAKLLTQSYDFDDESCGHGAAPKGVGCDNAVDGDPVTLFADPEFQRLNPHVGPVGDGYQVPTVVSGESDMTWELTRWLAASKAAKSFVDGTFDPWGEHVNTDYLNLALPTQSFTSMDSYPLIAHRYDPVFPLSAVAQYQADNWYPATDWEIDQTGNYPKLNPEVPGDRALFAVLDQGDAAAYQLPVVAIQNHAGRYVRPTPATMAAAVGEMYTESNHITQDVPETGRTARAKNAYPLTMVIYAMVPTSGIPAAKAAKIAQFLDFVADAGQQPGSEPGELPPGYLPLPAKLRAQTLAAAQKVAGQGGRTRPSASASASPSASPTPASTPSPRPSPSPSRTVSLGYAANPATSGVGRYVLPVLLISGAVLALGGSSALAVGRGSATAAAWLRRRRIAAPRRLLRGQFPRKKP